MLRVCSLEGRRRKEIKENKERASDCGSRRRGIGANGKGLRFGFLETRKRATLAVP